MFDLQDLYQDIVMDHNRRPRNFGILNDATFTADGFNPLCGDQIKLYLKVEDNIVTNVAFDGVGCAISKSSASMMTDSIKGMTLEKVDGVFNAFRSMITRRPEDDYDSEILGDLEILQGVSRYPARIKCATLSWHTLRAALTQSEDPITTE